MIFFAFRWQQGQNSSVVWYGLQHNHGGGRTIEIICCLWRSYVAIITRVHFLHLFGDKVMIMNKILIFLYPPLQQSWKGGILVSCCLSVRLWTKPCPLCIFHNACRIHFIFAHLMKQLQKVSHVRVIARFQNSLYQPWPCWHVPLADGTGLLKLQARPVDSATIFL